MQEKVMNGKNNSEGILDVVYQKLLQNHHCRHYPKNHIYTKRTSDQLKETKYVQCSKKSLTGKTRVKEIGRGISIVATKPYLPALSKITCFHKSILFSNSELCLQIHFILTC